MESNSIKIQFSTKFRSKDLASPLVLSNAGHLVFNVPEQKPFPLFSLSLNNQSELYKVGRSFVEDIANNKTQFGFASLTDGANDNSLLAYGSFINFTLKRSVLLVVRDLNDKSWDEYRKNFTPGTLWKWNCCDWGDLCLIDYEEIAKHAESFNTFDFNIVADEFAAILWSLPTGDLHKSIPKSAFNILQKINSVTLILNQGKTLGKELKDTIAYYKCFSIPVKGVLVEAVNK